VIVPVFRLYDTGTGKVVLRGKLQYTLESEHRYDTGSPDSEMREGIEKVHLVIYLEG